MRWSDVVHAKRYEAELQSVREERKLRQKGLDVVQKPNGTLLALSAATAVIASSVFWSSFRHLLPDVELKQFPLLKRILSFLKGQTQSRPVRTKQRGPATSNTKTLKVDGRKPPPPVPVADNSVSTSAQKRSTPAGTAPATQNRSAPVASVSATQNKPKHAGTGPATQNQDSFLPTTSSQAQPGSADAKTTSASAGKKKKKNKKK